MNGVAGVPQYMSAPKAKAKASNKGEGDKVPFGKFFNNKMNQVDKKGSEAKPDGKEVKMLKKALKNLEKLKEKLLGQGKVDLKGKDLKELIEEMSQDKDFIELLPLDLQALMQKLEQGDFTGVSKADMEKLMNAWEMKNSDLIKEIDQLMTAVKERLELVKDQPKKADKSKTQGKWNQFFSNPVDQKGVDLEKIDLKEKGLELNLKDKLNSKDEVSIKDLKKALNKNSKDLFSKISDIFDKVETKGFAQFEQELKKMLANNQKTITTDTNYMQFKLEGETNTAVMAETKDDTNSDSGKEHNPQSNLDIAMNSEIAQADVKDAANEFMIKDQRFKMPEPEQLFRQIVEKFNLEIKDGISEMEIKLQPEELGKMHLKLTMDDGTVTARFLAENSKVKELIEKNLALLRDTFATEDIHWDEITVDVGQDELAENPFASEQQFDEDDSKGDSRFSLNPDEMVLGEDIEIEEEEKDDPDKLVDYLA